MLELATLAETLITPAVQDVLTQKGVEAALMVGSRGVQLLNQRLREVGEPVRHELQRAVRRAHLKATLITCNACLLELGVRPRRWERAMRFQFQRGKDVRELDALVEALLADLRDASRPGWTPPLDAGGFDVEPHLLVAAEGTEADGPPPALADELQRRVVEQLSLEGWPVPERLREMLLEGWDIQQDDGKPEHHSWFAWMCACFVDLLRRDQEVRAIFDSTLLAQLAGRDSGLRLEELESTWRSWGAEVVERLEQTDGALADVLELQHELASSQQETLAAVRAIGQDMAAALRDRPDRDQSVERETVTRVERLVRTVTGRLFVGRRADVDRLSAFIDDNPSGALVVTAPAGFGKTALLANWLNDQQGAGFVAYHFFSAGDERLRSVQHACGSLLRQLFAYYRFDERERFPTESSYRDKIGEYLGRHKAPNGPLVILMDGLDEADEDASESIFPSELPEGVYVIVSVRSEDGRLPRHLKGWDGYAERHELDRLQPAAIITWLREFGDGELADLADDEAFVDACIQKSEGSPLHLRYLAEDLVEARSRDEDLAGVLERTPTGLTEYLDDQLNHLSAPGGLQAQLDHLLALLSVAKGPLRLRELRQVLAGMGHPELTDGDFRMLLASRNVFRWLSVTGAGRDSSWTFPQLVLAETFAQLMSGTAAARRELLAWCARWPEHRSEYALRHYHEHLLDAVDERHEHQAGDLPAQLHELYRLARQPAFRRAQAAAFPDEPELPLRPLQAAIKAAALVDDAGAMAEFVLDHLAALTPHRPSSPLEALLGDGDLRRAGELADAATPPRPVLWRLLLAWALCDAGGAAAAADTLDRLPDSRLPLPGWQGDLAATLLPRVLDAGPDRVRSIAERFLDDRQRLLACTLLLEAPLQEVKPLALAASIVATLGSPSREVGLARLARARARRQDLDGARSTLWLVEQAAGATPQAGWPEPLLAAMALAWAEVDDAEAAMGCAMAVADPRDRAAALLGMAAIQAARRDPRVAASLEAAGEAAREVGLTDDWAALRQELEQLRTGSGEERDDGQLNPAARLVLLSRDTRDWLEGRRTEVGDDEAFAAVRQAARDQRPPLERTAVLLAMAESQHAAGRHQDAVRSYAEAAAAASAVEEPAARLVAVVIVMRHLIDAGGASAARGPAAEIADPSARGEALELVGRAELAAGDGPAAEATLTAATDTVARVEDDSLRAELLAGLADAWAEAGLEARATTTRRDAWAAAMRVEEREARLRALSAVVVQGARAVPDAAFLDDLVRQYVELRDEPLSLASYLVLLGRQVAVVAGVEAAAPLFERAREAMATVDDPKRDMTKLILTLLEVAEDGAGLDTALERATAMAPQLQRPEFRASAFLLLAQTCARYGDSEQAAERFVVAAREALAVPGPVERASALELLTDTWAAARETGPGPVRAQLDDLVWNPPPDPAGAEMAIVALVAAARAALREEAEYDGRSKLAAARAAAEDVADPGRAAVLRAVVARAEARPVVEVSAATLEASRNGQLEISRVRLLAEVAVAEVHAGRGQEALATIERATEEAGDLTDELPRALALAAVARAQLVRGDAEPAEGNLEAARRAAGAVPDPADRAAILVAVAAAQAAGGDQPGARGTLADAAAAAAAADPARGAETLGLVGDQQLAALDLTGALATCERLEGVDTWAARELRLRIAWTQDAGGDATAARGTVAGVLGGEQSADGDGGRQRDWRLATIGRLRAEAGEAEQAEVIAGWIDDEAVRAALLDDLAGAWRAPTGPAAGPPPPAGLQSAVDAALARLYESASGAPAAGGPAPADLAPKAATGTASRGAQGLTEQQRRQTDRRSQDFAEAAVRTAEWIKVDRSRDLLEDAAQLHSERERTSFERLLVPCAHYPEAAYGICALLALEYKRQADRVAAAVREFG